MRFLVASLILILTGCVSLVKYQNLEKNLESLTLERDEASKGLEACADQNKELKKDLKMRPSKPMAEIKIDQDELNAIKKKALEEVELKYKARLKLKR